MAKVLGIEYWSETLDGDAGAWVLMPPEYPVAFELIVPPEEVILAFRRRAQQLSEQGEQ